MRRNIFAVFAAALVLTVFVFSYAPARAALKDSEVPADLSKWKSWVLHNMNGLLCPTNYNNEDVYRCTWPSRLKLSINSTGGSFEQEWTVFAETWAPLPGGTDMWPGNVKDGHVDIPVTSRNNVPSVYLKPGKHLIKGTFTWKETPEMILVPSETGIVSLAINGKAIAYPVMDANGQLWLQKRVSSEDQENAQSLSIFRLVRDSIPMEVTSRLQINISGHAREIRFENVLLKDSIPMRIDTPLPARIGNNGALMVQARPGRWEIDITTRFAGPVTRIGPVACAHGQEIWSFEPQNHLRMVKVEGAPSVEPGRTNMPSEWKQYSAYGIDPGAEINFKTLRRGDPDPAPDRLTLNKIVWLDFNGEGFTIQDNISGTISRTWRLTMNPPGKLGRVLVDGQGQLITADEKTGKAGVEIRNGRLNMTADSRYTDSIRLIPAVGWDHNFNSMSGTLNLPPGWRLFAARGVDKMPGAWILQWTLLDFFLVLIIGAAVLKLKGWKWGLVALIAMSLAYHEPGAPKIIWLHILAPIALIPILPDSWFKRLVYMWGGAATVVLLVMLIPFMVSQIRCGIFPQLELPRAYSEPWDENQMVKSEVYEQRPVQELAEADKSDMEALETQAVAPEEKAYAPQIQIMAKRGSQYPSDSLSFGRREYARKKAVYAQDPNALIQTGPGLPSWKWKSIPMTWNGPVNKDQEIRLWLLSPSANLALSFIRVILLALMVIGIVDIRSIWKKAKANMNTAGLAASVLIMFAGIANAETGSFPPQDILKEYQNRLLEKADCFPNCADCMKMDMKVEPDHLRILLELHAAARTAVPLPGSLTSWMPDQILLNTMPVKELSRDAAGILWMLVPEGVHKVVLIGKTGAGNSMQIPLPLTPHSATYTGNGWDVQGIHRDGKVESGIQLTRLKKETSGASLSAGVSLPPFLSIERVISLGLTWEMTTTVRRITPEGTPVVVSVPLVDGESVTTAGIRVENGKALVNMDPASSEVVWNSSLKETEDMSLKAPESVPWTETWILDASPIWHCEPSGIPAVHHQDEHGQWRPTWQPWPGETVSINITRPKGLHGRMVTIDSARLVLTPGLRSNKSQLTIQIRTSQGGQHQITLPEKAELQLVKINDKSQPIRQEGNKVVIPLQPGSQSVFLEWDSRSSSAMLIKGPAVQIGEQAVNAHVSFQMPNNRWILWTFGPRLGPAVLYWSYILIIILAAFVLGKIHMTPLKTHHWLILSLGLTQIPAGMALIVAGWFLVLGTRKKYPPAGKPFSFNLIQAVIAAWTIAAFMCLYRAISEGLLGIPDMQIAGNGSTAAQLNWTQDRITAMMPQPVVISLPKFVYNIMILIWALWLVFYLIKWLKWGWGCFTEGGIWKKSEGKRKPPPPNAPEPKPSPKV